VECVERAGGVCEWSDCDAEGKHMSHIDGLGIGGPDTLDNVMLLCIYHHDLLDGREMMRQREVAYLLHELNELRSRER
jgi:predicted restriction endonuclease